MPIPRILHQMWRDAELPERWQRMRQTWLNHHPHWEHPLWTDASLREFIAIHYPKFLSIHDAYPAPIMRADLARYLLLEHFGGVYADLDTECLRPIEPLLDDHTLLFPLEPDAHLQSKTSIAAGMRRIVGNAWMASVPDHPFWTSLKERLLTNQSSPDQIQNALQSTGPFLLSAVVDACEDPASRPHLLPAASVQPATNTDGPWLSSRQPGSAHWYGPDTYALHYWEGTWWRKQQEQTILHLLRGNEALLTGVLSLSKTKTFLQKPLSIPSPLISCLMVTGSRRSLAMLAVQCFRRQTYPHRELIVIDDSGQDLPADLTEQGDDAGRIRWIQVPPENKPLGALRNLSLQEARGDFLCQWDDDDLSSPNRLQQQMLALTATGADACGLHRLQLWWPESDRFAISSSRLWECALMWQRGAITSYPELRAGEDTPPVAELAQRGRIAMIDAPDLYTYICHGRNTFATSHWEQIWRASHQKMDQAACRTRLQIMQPALPLDEYLQALQLPGLRQHHSEIPPALATPVTPRTSSATIHLPQKQPLAELPRILVATPIKDAVPFLERFFHNLLSTDYPLDRVSLAFLESDSQDATASLAKQLLNQHGPRFARTSFHQQAYGLHLEGARWEPAQQLRRRSILAQSRNGLLETALQEETWVMWIDADVHAWQPDVFRRLLESRHSIVTPHCVKSAYGGESYDLNAFVFRDPKKRDGTGHLLDGIQQPPAGLTRFYLDSFRDHEEVELDSVGGTMLLINADLHRDGLRFPARSFNGYIETEGLAQMAQHFGVKCWGLPQVEIVHP